MLPEVGTAEARLLDILLGMSQNALKTSLCKLSRYGALASSSKVLKMSKPLEKCVVTRLPSGPRDGPLEPPEKGSSKVGALENLSETSMDEIGLRPSSEGPLLYIGHIVGPLDGSNVGPTEGPEDGPDEGRLTPPESHSTEGPDVELNTESGPARCASWRTHHGCGPCAAACSASRLW